MVYTLDLRGDIYHFNRDENNKNKYIVFACAKNENDYIQEWVDYHLGIGFDKVIICDNNEVGDDSLYGVLGNHIRKGVVEIFDIRGAQCFQNEVYDMFSSSNDYKWCAFIDIDEFIEIGKHYINIKEFLSTVKENCVLLNWMVYGYDKHLVKTSDNVQERFKTPIRHVGMYKENAFLKSIVRGGSSPRFYGNMHVAYFSENPSYLVGGSIARDFVSRFHFPPLYKEIYLRHYYSRSICEYFKKTKRSDASMIGNDDILTNGYNVALLGNTGTMPIEKFSLGLYMSDDKYDDNELLETLSGYEVINVSLNFDGELNPYHFIHFISRMMMMTTNHVFILSGVVDDAIYNILLDFSFETGNKVVYCEEDKDLLYKTFLKYRTDLNNEFYYKFNLR